MITLNALEIGFHAVSITTAGQTQAAKVSLDDKLERATFTAEQPLPEGPASVHIKYTGPNGEPSREVPAAAAKP